jgi:tRNA uridine 5-carboxymethylaminomethyl modification enzyme
MKGKNKYDVIVIGAGHAGCEAALASAGSSAKTLLISINMDTVELMPFGNELGGFGKDLLLKEADYMGGEIYKNVKRNYICSRLEKNKENPQTITTRVLVDRRNYSLSMKRVLENKENLDLRQGLAVEVSKKGKVYRLRTSDGIIYSCNCLVICTGTFLGARIFWGRHRIEAGRQGEICSKRFLDNLKKEGLKFSKIKSYIAPAVDEKTIKISNLEKEGQKEEKKMFLLENGFKNKKQMNYYKTYINDNFISCILKYKGNKRTKYEHDYNYEINFLPIEERILDRKNEAEREIFILPLGRKTGERYLMGLENALPEELQEEMLKMVSGLNEAEMTRPGYGIEYNCLGSSELDKGLQSKKMRGVYFAGRINRTHGYEESAAQGIIAGINASRRARGLRSILLNREESCTGMLINSITMRKKGSVPYSTITTVEEYLRYRGQTAGIIEKRSLKIYKS